jgi:hypothetical protein
MSNKENRDIQKNIREWIATGLAAITFAFSIYVSFTAKEAVNEVNTHLESVQTQYQDLQNIINQQQSVDVIEARDNDVLIMTPDGKWIVVPMIENSDIMFSSDIIEQKMSVGESTLDRYDLFNENSDDWTARDSFTYVLPTLTINQNKMVSLYQFINSIDVEFKLYDEDQINFEKVSVNIFNQHEEYTYLNVFESIMPQYQFVTDDGLGLNGIEEIKISVIIEFEISDVVFSIPYVFDDFVNVNQDF